MPRSPIANQLAFPGLAAPRLDAATIRRLRAVGVRYVETAYNEHFEHWEHRIAFDCPRRGAVYLAKTDAGIVSLLERRNASAHESEHL